MMKFTTSIILFLLICVVNCQNTVFNESIILKNNSGCHYEVLYRISSTLCCNWICFKILNSNCEVKTNSDFSLVVDYKCNNNWQTNNYVGVNFNNWESHLLCSYDEYPTFIVKYLVVNNENFFSSGESISMNKTKITNENISSWSDWFGPSKIKDHDKLFYYIKYQAKGGGIYAFKVKFKNNYTDIIDFYYVLEPKWIAPSQKNSISIEIKAGNEFEDNQVWLINEPSRLKTEDIVVTLYNTLFGNNSINEPKKIFENNNVKPPINSDERPKYINYDNAKTVQRNNSVRPPVYSEDKPKFNNTIHDNDENHGDSDNQMNRNFDINQILDTLNNNLNRIKETQKMNNENFNKKTSIPPCPCGGETYDWNDSYGALALTLGINQRLSNGKTKYCKWNGRYWIVSIDSKP